MDTPQPSDVWRHWRGGLYVVYFLVEHTETKEILVIYGTDGKKYARPLNMWNTEARVGVRRFTLETRMEGV